MKPKNIILYDTGALGDLIINMPTLHSIAILFPDAEQTLMGNSMWLNLLLPSQWPKITFFLECERRSFAKLTLYKPNRTNNTWEKVGEIPSLSKFLKNYSMGFNLHLRSSRFLLALLRARVPIRVGSHKSSFLRFFYTYFVRDEKIGHNRDRHLHILAALNKDFTNQQKSYWKIHGIPPLKNYELQKFKEKFGSSFIVINPTSSIRAKAWDSKNFKLIVDTLVNQNKKIIVVGAEHEMPWLQEVATDKAEIYCSKSLFDVCDLIAAAQLFITNTSSLQFIAASTGTKTITLMGSAKAIEWGPLGKDDRVIQAAPSNEDINIQTDKTLDRIERQKKLEQVAYARISVQRVLDAIYDCI